MADAFAPEKLKGWKSLVTVLVLLIFPVLVVPQVTVVSSARPAGPP